MKNNHNQLSAFNFQLSTSAGFTLIELLVVFAVIAILSAVGFASYVSYSREQALSAAASDVYTMLLQAKSRAQSQVKPSSCTANNALVGYVVKITIDNINNIYRYELDVDCGASIPIKTKSLPTSITFCSTGCPASEVSKIEFSVITGGVVFTPSLPVGFSSGKIQVDDAYGNSKTITIDPSGNISPPQ